MTDTRSGRVLCSAGKRPKKNPVPSVSAAANNITEGSSVNVAVSAASFGSIPAMRDSVHRATTRPATPPKNASRHDSKSS